MTFDEWFGTESMNTVCEWSRREEYLAAWNAAVAAERERCARVAHGHYLAEGPPVAPLGSHLAIRRAAGATIADAIRATPATTS